MDNYFIAKKFVRIITNNLNNHFMHALNNYMYSFQNDELNRNFVNIIIK